MSIDNSDRKWNYGITSLGRVLLLSGQPFTSWSALSLAFADWISFNLASDISHWCRSWQDGSWQGISYWNWIFGRKIQLQVILLQREKHALNTWGALLMLHLRMVCNGSCSDSTRKLLPKFPFQFGCNSALIWSAFVCQTMQFQS